MKRIISVCCVLSLFLLCMRTAYAESGAYITGETEYVKKGGYVDYSVNISGNPGISAYLIYVDCDTDVFSLDYDDASQAYKVTNGPDFLDGTINCNINGTRGYQVSWYSGTGYVQKDGDLFTLRLKVADNAREGTYPVTIRYSEKNTLDTNMEKLPLTCVSGTITVAPNIAKFTVENCEAIPGEQCILRVRIDENPGIAAYSIVLLMDTNMFSAIPKDNGDGYAVASGSKTAPQNILCNSYRTTGYRIQWWNSTEDIRAGTLFELPLMVSENAAPGTYEVTIQVIPADTTDEKGNRVSTQLENGSITIGDNSWKAVTADYNSSAKTVTVTGTPLMKGPSGSVNLIAASYSDKGQMLSCKMIAVENAALSTPQSFTLTCPDREKTVVKLFAVDGKTYVPLCKPFLIDTK